MEQHQLQVCLSRCQRMLLKVCSFSLSVRRPVQQLLHCVCGTHKLLVTGRRATKQFTRCQPDVGVQLRRAYSVLMLM
jgi:hypothetical protein